MSWSFLPGLVAAFSEASCSDTDASAQSSTTPTPDQFYWPDKPTEHSRISRFGMTCAPLTGDRGEALLMWFREASRARTSASQERVPDWTASAAGYGEKWPASLARFDPDSRLWRTAQHSLLGDSDEFSVTWPRSGMTAGGRCWEQPMLGRRTRGTDSGFWPTPTVCGNHNRKGASATSGDGLATAVRMWPTPTARDYRSDSCTAEVKAERDAQSRGKTLPWEVGGLLNPDWVELLMGWPKGHTRLEAK